MGVSENGLVHAFPAKVKDLTIGQLIVLALSGWGGKYVDRSPWVIGAGDMGRLGFMHFTSPSDWIHILKEGRALEGLLWYRSRKGEVPFPTHFDPEAVADFEKRMRYEGGVRRQMEVCVQWMTDVGFEGCSGAIDVGTALLLAKVSSSAPGVAQTLVKQIARGGPLSELSPDARKLDTEVVFRTISKAYVEHGKTRRHKTGTNEECYTRRCQTVALLRDTNPELKATFFWDAKTQDEILTGAHDMWFDPARLPTYRVPDVTDPAVRQKAESARGAGYTQRELPNDPLVIELKAKAKVRVPRPFAGAAEIEMHEDALAPAAALVPLSAAQPVALLPAAGLAATTAAVAALAVESDFGLVALVENASSVVVAEATELVKKGQTIIIDVLQPDRSTKDAVNTPSKEHDEDEDTGEPENPKAPREDDSPITGRPWCQAYFTRPVPDAISTYLVLARTDEASHQLPQTYRPNREFAKLMDSWCEGSIDSGEQSHIRMLALWAAAEASLRGVRLEAMPASIHALVESRSMDELSTRCCRLQHAFPAFKGPFVTLPGISERHERAPLWTCWHLYAARLCKVVPPQRVLAVFNIHTRHLPSSPRSHLPLF